MNTAELIQAARKCADRTTDCKDCIMAGKDDCRVQLAGMLADKLEEAISDLEVLKECETCCYSDYPLKENTPCWKCGMRHWRWRGDRDE
ncbi:MAG: hypothetical protein IJ410_03475 [Oscillospiraceae bacterium]|nr:hypothetical protein [Oscillospiraceae bacterium]